MLLIIWTFLLIGLVISSDPDVGKDMEQICISKGYTSVERHDVQTTDGFVLGVFRLPQGRNQITDPTVSKPAVLLQHGLLDSSWTWVNNFPSESLGFLLADNGYDVWFGNSRGNYYSSSNVNYPVTSTEFWNFTFDDMAQFDVPAMINYILQTTGRQNLSYVGHSQGTIQAFAAFSSNPSLTTKVNLAVMLAPVAYVSHAGGLLPLMAHLDLDEMFLIFGFHDFLPDSSILQWLAPDICNWFPYGCEDFLFLLVGDSANLNATRIDVYVSETPAGTSVKNMAHWAQGIRSNVFQKFDYGSASANMAIYGQSTPPQYDLTQVQVPCALYYGGNDILADSSDVKVLLSKLPKIVKADLQPNFAHLDYTWGYDASASSMYMDVIALIKQYNV